MNLKREIDLLVYPKGASFAVLLTWHLKRGTTPDGTTEEIGTEILLVCFAATINEALRNVANWCNGHSRPSNPGKVEKALFGTNPLFKEWRADFRIACARNTPILSEEYNSRNALIRNATQKAGETESAASLSGLGPARAIATDPPPFFPLDVLFKLKRAFVATTATDCQLNISEYRERLISTVLELVYENPNSENFNHLKRVASFMRVFYHSWKSDRLWYEAAEVVHQRYQGRYDGAFALLKAFRDVRTEPNKAIVYAKFAGYAAERLALGDANGFCEARVKHADMLIFQKRLEEATDILLDTEVRFREMAATPDEFAALYDQNLSGNLSDILISLTRSEFAQGNLIPAQIYSRRASRYAVASQDRHRLGNCAENEAILASLEGRDEQALHFKKRAIRFFEEFGDEARANFTRQLLTSFMPHRNSDF